VTLVRGSCGLLISAALFAGCSATSKPSPSPTSNAASSTDPAPGAVLPMTQVAVLAALKAELTPPALPIFTVPLASFEDAKDRDIATRLKLPPGLYDGIAVVDLRCTAAGGTHGADMGASTTTGRSQTYDDGTTRITVSGSGAGTYRSGQLRVTVSGLGAGTLSDATRRIAVNADGSGTLVNGEERFTVNADGSGTVISGQLRVYVDGHGNGTYRDGKARVRVEQGKAVSSSGLSSAQTSAVTSVLSGELPRFPKVPPVSRVIPAAGRSCGTVIRLDANVLFSFDDSRVQPAGTVLLSRVARLLVALDSPKVRVDGFTDGMGSADYNLNLSAKRAAAVRQVLIADGAQASSLTTRGLGEASPLRPETTPDGADDASARALNRRVELVLLDQGRS
jgi:OOP family OmpA-OmpF porin